MASRFGCATEAEITEKKTNINAKNTLKSNKKAAKQLQDYLMEKNMDERFENMTDKQLNDILIDIIKDPAFREANISYKAAIKELKQEGKGYVKHYPIISDSDLQKMYQSMYFDISTPCGLQNKVQLDIRLYFRRRGAENMHSMNKDTFVVQTGADGTRYVCQAVDELTKNHRENDKEATSGFMPEIPNSNLCPVKSFVSYTSKLNSSNNKLWQKPKDSFCSEENVWFCNIAVGQRSLSNFMTKMSAICELSTKYTEP
ncbi:uncharacterized protein [Clytia hemisphaerica]|uniref:uncharacterized protein n=1 Tax=Clytia hemisphaerica TaxID=252671 RepID=UPI0034D5241C